MNKIVRFFIIVRLRLLRRIEEKDTLRHFKLAQQARKPEVRGAAFDHLLYLYRECGSGMAAYYVGLLSNDESRYPQLFHRPRARQAFAFGAQRGHAGCFTQLALTQLLLSRPDDNMRPIVAQLMAACEDVHPQAQEAITRAGVFLSSHPQAQWHNIGRQLLTEAARHDQPLACAVLARGLLTQRNMGGAGRCITLLRVAAKAGDFWAAGELALALARFEPQSPEPLQIVQWLLGQPEKTAIQEGSLALEHLYRRGASMPAPLLQRLIHASATACLVVVEAWVMGNRAVPAPRLWESAKAHAKRGARAGYIAAAFCALAGVGISRDEALALRYLRMGWRDEGGGSADLFLWLLSEKNPLHPARFALQALEAEARRGEDNLFLLLAGQIALQLGDLALARRFLVLQARVYHDALAIPHLIEVYTKMERGGKVKWYNASTRKWG